jgi:hypothetical protein
MPTFEPVSVREREFRGRRLGEAGDWDGIFGVAGPSRATSTVLSRVLAAKPRKVKGYSAGRRKPEWRRTAWWGR